METKWLIFLIFEFVFIFYSLWSMDRVEAEARKKREKALDKLGQLGQDMGEYDA
jgi:hypothetical protein